MRGAAWRIGLGAAAAALAAAAIVLALRSPANEARPKLLLLTSLPIIFDEDFTLRGNGSPALTALSRSFEVIPISVADGPQLGKGRLLLMAQPFAQAPENLVELDAWVRKGGRLLLLADPALEWPSKRPLGDRARPPPMFVDTNILAHWGLRLDEPRQRGPVARRLGKFQIIAVSPGQLLGDCDIRDGGFDARCRVGKGRVIIIADADFLNTPALNGDGRQNLEALIAELASLDRS